MKKTTMILGLLASTFLISGASAMEPMDGSMMHKDNMTTSSTDMMKKDIMMDMSKMSLMKIIKHYGYNWAKDRKTLATMAGIENYTGTVKQNMMIRSYLLTHKRMKDTMMKKEAMSTQSEKMIKTDIMKKDLGMYSTYSSTAVSSALATGKTVYLFFAASWCPGCRSLDTSITGGVTSIPENTVIFKVDYDNSTELKKQYGITIQHTVVKLNSDGSLMKKIIGPTSVSQIVK